ncbi:MAG: VWA domain-containing protein [Chloroflexota bacterium]
MHLNPYVAGNPVGGSSAFVGRADVLRSVLRMLNNPGSNALVLFGQRRIGKTSVLRHLEQSLPESGAFKPIYFDLQDKAALPLNTVLEQLAQRIVSRLGLVLTTDYSTSYQEAFHSQFIPNVLDGLQEDASLVILFDEFDVLDSEDQSQAGTAFFPYLRELMDLDPRLQFIFVIGRRPEDLSSLTLSVFKGINQESVTLLSQHDTMELVKLGQKNDSLVISDSVAEQIYSLTGGHPYLTQQLCQEIWEEAYEEDPDEPPTIGIQEIEAAIEPALRHANNALEWIWDGLSPAQRIVASALATAGKQSMSRVELEQRLHESGVRILVSELRDAPVLLERLDLIRPEQEGYRFHTELLRRWIVDNKTLNRVQEELDHIEPAAENLFQAAYIFYRTGNLEQAAPLLEQVIGLNPNHARGMQVLSEIRLAQGDLDKALILLRSLYEYNPVAARPRLIQALLTQAQSTQSSSQRLSLYDEILVIDPQQSEAKQGRRRIWIAQIHQLEANEQYGEALLLGRMVAEEVPPNHPDHPDLELLKRKTALVQNYHQAIGALEADDKERAIQLLVDIVGIEPNYQNTTRYLHLAVTGEDVKNLESELENKQLELEQVRFESLKDVDKLKHVYLGIESERQSRQQAEQQLTRLQLQLGVKTPESVRQFFLSELYFKNIVRIVIVAMISVLLYVGFNWITFRLFPMELAIAVPLNTAPLLTKLATQFNNLDMRSPENQRLKISILPMTSEQAMQEILGEPSFHAVSSESNIWLAQLEQAWQTKGTDSPISPAIKKIEFATSPVVLAIWEHIVTELEWQDKPITWKNIQEQAISNPEFTWGIPNISTTSGLLAVAGYFFAGAKETEALSMFAVSQADTQQYVKDVAMSLESYKVTEQTIIDSLESGSGAYLDAFVIQEQFVVNWNSGVYTQSADSLMAIYPSDGTLFETYSLSYLNFEDENNTRRLAEGRRVAFDLFSAFLTSDASKSTIETAGLRVLSQTVLESQSLATQVESAGIDRNGPSVQLDLPSIEILDSVKDFWVTLLPPRHIYFLVDVSGSMEGEKLASVKSALINVIDKSKGTNDKIRLITYSDEITLDTGLVPVNDETYSGLKVNIGSLFADGGTSHYDTILYTLNQLQLDSEDSIDLGKIIVSISDGQDTSSRASLQDVIHMSTDSKFAEIEFLAVSIGNDVDINALNEIAQTMNGGVLTMSDVEESLMDILEKF